MANTIIIVDSNGGGADTKSGCGPGDGVNTGTEVAGTAATTDGAGTTVTLDALTDLTNVAAGHVIYLHNTGAGARRHAKVTATAGSGGATPTVTVSEALAATAGPFNFSIGGKKVSAFGATSALLFNNNGSAGDAMPGWVVEMQSAHTESRSSELAVQRAGTTAGPITIRGKPGAATRPVVTFTGNVRGLRFYQQYWRVEGFNLVRTGSTQTTQAGIDGVVSNCVVRDMKVSAFGIGITVESMRNAIIRDTEVTASYADGITATSSYVGMEIHNCRVHTNVGNGITCSSSDGWIGCHISGTLVYANGGIGISLAFTGTDAAPLGTKMLRNNTINGNTSDGVKITASSTQYTGLGFMFLGNAITTNGGYGINFSGSSVSDVLLFAQGARVWNTTFGTGGTANTSGQCNLTLTLCGENNLSVDPGYTNAGTGDFSVGTAMKALGEPLTGPAVAIQKSYVDIGAWQRQEAAGGGGSGEPANLCGGIHQ